MKIVTSQSFLDVSRYLCHRYDALVHAVAAACCAGGGAAVTGVAGGGGCAAAAAVLVLTIWVFDFLSGGGVRTS